MYNTLLKSLENFILAVNNSGWASQFVEWNLNQFIYYNLRSCWFSFTRECRFFANCVQGTYILNSNIFINFSAHIGHLYTTSNIVFLILLPFRYFSFSYYVVIKIINTSHLHWFTRSWLSQYNFPFLFFQNHRIKKRKFHFNKYGKTLPTAAGTLNVH
jgi:hypothetical protein